MIIMDSDHIWLTKKIYDDAERTYYENSNKAALTPLAGEVAKARQRLIESRDNFTECISSIDAGAVKFFEKKVLELQMSIEAISKKMDVLEHRVSLVESKAHLCKPPEQREIESCPAPIKSQPKLAADNENDDVDLFGSDSDEENEAAAKVREERLAAYAAKKAKKPTLIAKSNVILDIKPWDDETDMKAMEEQVRKIEADGLLWGTSKLVPLAYGIHKLQISSVVEDDKVSIDWLTEAIEQLEDYVQSVDIAAFNKI